MNKLTINQRFIDSVNLLISSKKVHLKSEIAEKLNIKKSTFSEILNLRMSISTEAIANFCDLYEINPTWLLTGKGSMLLDQGEDKIIAERVTSFSGRISQEVLYPITSIHAIGGFGNEFGHITEMDISDYCSIPLFKDKKVDFIIPISGDSMVPKFYPGDYVACSVLKDKELIQWNKAFIVATKSQGILLKRLKKSEKENYLLALSDNIDYPPFDVPMDEITGIALVVGVIRLE